MLFLMREDLPAAARYALSAVAYAERIGDPSAQVRALAHSAWPTRSWEVENGETPSRVVLPSSAKAIPSARRDRLVLLAVNLTWADEFDEARKIFHTLRERASETAEDSALPWILRT